MMQYIIRLYLNIFQKSEIINVRFRKIMMVKKHYNSIVLLSIAIEKMKKKNIEELQIDIELKKKHK